MDMTSIREARGIVADAEKALRELMQREIQDQRYADIPEVARLADGVARLLRGQIDDRPARPARSVATQRGKLRLANRSSRGKKRYPRFERDGYKLVKVGWSKKGREEYEHRAPRDVVAAFTRHLVSKVKRGKAFVVEDLLPVPDSSGGEIPSYQVYMTLRWLRHAGAVEKRGRDGYALIDAQLDENGFDALWGRIPERS